MKTVLLMAYSLKLTAGSGRRNDTLQKIDKKKKQVHVILPEGLLDVNAPLTAEEKLAQRKSKA